MGDTKGFINIKRQHSAYRPVCERVKDYKEVAILRSNADSKIQASRCMDCGTPFCHWACPLGNVIPEWNDLAFNGKWENALQLLSSTNNFPEFTGRLCPALCEYSCVLGINDDPVTVRENELAIIEHAYNEGRVKAAPPKKRTGKKVAVIGSGPSGLACADQLNKAGHFVTVFEKDKKAGGILRYGIPDFKLDKSVIDRRVNLMVREGVTFKTGVTAGGDMPAEKLKKEFDAVCLAGGSRVPRDLAIEGRSLNGIYFAMDYLAQSNKRVAREEILDATIIDAKGKKVVVIGGGDTGSDCVGTAHRQGASCVVQIELMPKPADSRPSDYPWPRYPLILKTSSSHEEGGERHWAVQTRRFAGEGNAVKKLVCSRVDFSGKDANGRPAMKEVPGSEFEIEADMVVLAMGFVGPDKKGLVDALNLALDQRGNIKTNNEFMSSQKGVFSAGDMRRGQSLIVWAIAEGRRCAYFIDTYLMGKSSLPNI